MSKMASHANSNKKTSAHTREKQEEEEEKHQPNLIPHEIK